MHNKSYYNQLASFYSDTSNVANFGIVNRLQGLGKKAKGVAVSTSKKLDDSIVAVGSNARNSRINKLTSKGKTKEATKMIDATSKGTNRKAGLARVGGVTAAVAGTGAAGVAVGNEYSKRRKAKQGG